MSHDIVLHAIGQAAGTSQPAAVAAAGSVSALHEIAPSALASAFKF